MDRLLPDGPSPLLQRVRLQFLMLTVLACAIALVDLLRVETIASLPGYLAVVAGLLVWGVAMFRRGDRWRWLDVIGPLLVAGVGISAGYYDWAFPSMYGALFLHGTYGSARRTAGAAVLYLAAYDTAMVVTAPSEFGVGALVSHGLGIFVVAYLTHTIAGAVRRHDDARQRERVLTRTGAQLLTAGEPDEVADIALAAVTEILGGPAEQSRVTLLRSRGDLLEVVALAGAPMDQRRLRLSELPPELHRTYRSGQVARIDHAGMAELRERLGGGAGFDHGLSVPLLDGEQLTGVLFVATHAPVDIDVATALERFMHEVSLADVLVRRQALLAGVVDNSADAILLVGRDDMIEFASPSVALLAGCDPSAAVGRPLGTLLFHRVDGEPVGVEDLQAAAEGTRPLFAGSGPDARQVELAISPLTGDALVVNLRDITERRRLEDEVTYRAFHDPLTGLANRALFADRVEQALARARRVGGRLAVALIDLDDFKAVNDVDGHSAGDRLLIETAERLTTALRDVDTCARFGGDEFAVLMEDVADEGEVTAVLGRVVEALRRPFTIGQRHVSVSASVGVRIGDGAELADILVGDADVAMYVAKADGKNQLVRFEDGMRLAAIERLQLKGELLAAIDADQLVLHYQPIVDLQSGEVTGFEALVRWSHPTRGLIAPDDFIPLAEETGVIVPLGRWVLDRACAQLAAWNRSGAVHADTRMSVNLSPHQLLAPRLLDDVVATLRSTGVGPGQLILEVTESALMAEPERAGEVLTALTGLGIAVAIDDFGTGYSSFAYLQRFPVAVIKVDRSFVARVAEGPEQAALAHAIVKLAQTLRMATVAEGVEEAAQEDLLSGWGCSHGQGWRWARAMTVADTTAWLADRRDPDGRAHAIPGRTPVDAGVPSPLPTT